ncbi:MAG: polysaccharide pyruvyl transferase family protein [Cyanobacteria bacterium J06635_10]
MNILIHGAHFKNKGAELMLLAIKQQLQTWPECQSVAGCLRTGTYQQRKQVGISHLTWRGAFRPPYNRIPYSIYPEYFISQVLPASLRKALNIIIETEIDAVLDASGFTIGDQWGIEKNRRMATLCSRWHQQGKKVILLPQAFGPFEIPEIRQAAKEVIDSSDLIIARDKTSYQNLISISGKPGCIKLFPDFTNILKKKTPDYIRELSGRACIIPNSRMIDSTPSDVSYRYLDFLRLCFEKLEHAKLNPFLLLHDKGDLELAKNLDKKITDGIEIVREEDSMQLKGIISEARVVVSSRFHGIVSALSQAVPCIATGWSHKYKELMQDYGCEEYIIDLKHKEYIEDRLNKIIDTLEDADSRHALVGNMLQRGSRQKQLTLDMWSEIHHFLKKA